MDENKTRHYKRLLLQLKNKETRLLNSMTEKGPNKSLREESHELSTYDNHPADIGTETYEMEKFFALKDNEKHQVEEIDKALENIETGKYGLCEFCGKEISYERLEVLPYANLCIDCENNKKLNMDDIGDERPVEEDVLLYPFGRSYMDEKDEIQFDGEDAWQAVQRYGSASGPQDISVNRLIKYNDVYEDSDEDIGIVDDVEKITNEEAEEQMPEE